MIRILKSCIDNMKISIESPEEDVRAFSELHVGLQYTVLYIFYTAIINVQYIPKKL